MSIRKRALPFKSHVIEYLTYKNDVWFLLEENGHKTNAMNNTIREM